MHISIVMIGLAVHFQYVKQLPAQKLLENENEELTL